MRQRVIETDPLLDAAEQADMDLYGSDHPDTNLLMHIREIEGASVRNLLSIFHEGGDFAEAAAYLLFHENMGNRSPRSRMTPMARSVWKILQSTPRSA